MYKYIVCTYIFSWESIFHIHNNFLNMISEQIWASAIDSRSSSSSNWFKDELIASRDQPCRLRSIPSHFDWISIANRFLLLAHIACWVVLSFGEFPELNLADLSSFWSFLFVRLLILLTPFTISCYDELCESATASFPILSLDYGSIWESILSSRDWSCWIGSAHWSIEFWIWISFMASIRTNGVECSQQIGVYRRNYPQVPSQSSWFWFLVKMQRYGGDLAHELCLQEDWPELVVYVNRWGNMEELVGSFQAGRCA